MNDVLNIKLINPGTVLWRGTGWREPGKIGAGGGGKREGTERDAGVM